MTDEDQGLSIMSPMRFLKEVSRPLRRTVAQQLYPTGGASDPAVDFLRRSYSGHGEDAYVLSWLTVEGRLKPDEIRYVDVGAAHPFALSNTYLMYSLGAFGTLIDPDPDHVVLLNAARPRDTTMQAGVAFDERRRGALIRFPHPVFNTFSEEQAAKIVAQSKMWGPGQEQSIRDRVEVTLVSLNEILARMGTVHFLNVDAEGVDFQILKSIDFSKHRPWMICIEASRPISEMGAVLEPYGYRFMSRTPDNTLFLLAPFPSNPDMVTR